MRTGGDDHPSWKVRDAGRFLEEARATAQERYVPLARFVKEHVPEGNDLPTVLDLGTGPGLLLVALGGLLPSARLLGVDPSDEMLELARRTSAESDITFEVREGSAEGIPAEDGSVDVVISQKNLHEWDDPERGFSEVARVLRPGGRFILQDANRAFPYWRLRLLVTWKRLTRGKEATKGYLGPYRHAYRPEEVQGFFERAGLSVVHTDAKGVEFTFVAER